MRMTSDQTGKPGQPFEVETVRQLAELMTKHDLSEIDLTHGSAKLRLRRGAVGGLVTLPTAAATLPTHAASAPTAPPAVAAAASKRIEIKSEAIGTFYSRPKPDAKPYVDIGSKVTPTTVVCQIEAMKIFNEIPAGCTGTIAEVCVENQQAVEYGTVLFRVDPT
jgi:acetyl-CoA carboxylase biotin carboxyl carrier protein